MKFSASPLSPYVIQLDWSKEDNDPLQDFVTIQELGANGQKDQQSPLPFLKGPTFFRNLSPSTEYKYQMIGIAQTEAGQTETFLASTSTTTLQATPTPPGPPRLVPIRQALRHPVQCFQAPGAYKRRLSHSGRFCSAGA